MESAIPNSIIINSIGALFLSNCLSMLMLGVLISKVIKYLSLFPHDRLFFKLIVAAMGVLSLGESIGYCALGWVWIVRDWGKIEALSMIPTSFAVVMLCWSIGTLINALFFAWRIYWISRNKVIVSYIVLGSLYQFGFMAYGYAPDFKPHVPVTSIANDLKVPGYVWIGIAVSIDLTITSSMFYYLGYRRKSLATSTDGSTERLLKGIMKRTVRYNALSLTILCIEYGLLLTSSKNGMWFGLGNSILVKILTFSIVMSLTARSTDGSAGFGSTGVVSSANATRMAATLPKPGVTVVVETSQTLEDRPTGTDPTAVPVCFEICEESEKYGGERIEMTEMV